MHFSDGYEHRVLPLPDLDLRRKGDQRSSRLRLPWIRSGFPSGLRHSRPTLRRSSPATASTGGRTPNVCRPKNIVVLATTSSRWPPRWPASRATTGGLPPRPGPAATVRTPEEALDDPALRPKEPSSRRAPVAGPLRQPGVLHGLSRSRGGSGSGQTVRDNARPTIRPGDHTVGSALSERLRCLTARLP